MATLEFGFLLTHVKANIKGRKTSSELSVADGIEEASWKRLA